MYKQALLQLIGSIFITALLYVSTTLDPMLQLLVVGFTLTVIAYNYFHATHGAPIEKRKRTMLVISFIVSLIACVGFFGLRGNTDWLFLPFVALILYIHLLLSQYLPKVDLNVLQFADELFIIQLLAGALVEITMYWSWALFSGIPVLMVKTVSVGIMALHLLLISFSLRKKGMIVSSIVFVVLAAIKTYSEASIGVPHYALYSLFGLMVGYLYSWTSETTETERKLGDNVNTSAVWIITVALSLVLVIL